MTMLDLTTAFTRDGLLAACATLGVRRPLGLTESMARHPSAGTRSGAPATGAPGAIGALGSVPVSDGTAAALAVLAAPEAIALVERVGRGRRRVTYVAVRGPWGAVHRIHGDHHLVESVDAEAATTELLTAARLADAAADGSPVLSWSLESDKPGAPTTTRAPEAGVVDVTRVGFDRMVELAAAGDVARAVAALEADGAPRGPAESIVEAARESLTHVLGLRSLGLRYEGCEVSWVGGDTARWLVPLPARSSDTGSVVAPLGAPRHVRVQIQPVTAAALTAELSTLFD